MWIPLKEFSTCLQVHLMHKPNKAYFTVKHLAPTKLFNGYPITIRLWGRYSLSKIIFGGVIIVLANKSITMCSFTLLSVSVMISSL